MSSWQPQYAGDRLAGLVVDSVIDVIMLNSDEMEQCPSIDDTKRSDYIMGVGKQAERLITVLSLDNLLGMT